MKKIHVLLSVVVLSAAFLAPVVNADISPWELRQTLNNYLTANEILAENSVSTNKSQFARNIAKSRNQINHLTDAQLQSMIDAMPNSQTYTDQVAKLLDAANKLENIDQVSAVTSSALNSFNNVPVLQSLTQPVLFPPAYPVGGNYDTFTATLDGFGLLSDGPDAGSETNDERCDSDGEAAQQIALATEKVICVLGELAADAIIEPISRGVAFGLTAICQEIVVATEITIAQCDLQDALVDGAEIEAAYENSKIISNQVTEVSVELDAHNTNIEGDINVHDTNISNKLDVHDIDIKNALNTHDTEIKSLLANIQAVVNANGNKIDVLLERQLDVVRLLHTPQGRRSSSVPACNGSDCNWPNKN